MMNQHSPMPCRIIALGESAEGDRFLRVEVLVQGRRKARLLSMRDLQASPDKAINQLGVPLLTRAARTTFLQKAQQAFQTLKPTFPVATKPGLLRGVFILPDGSCIPQNTKLRHACHKSFALTATISAASELLKAGSASRSLQRATRDSCWPSPWRLRAPSSMRFGLSLP
jgi:hypothetical protein